MVIHVDQPMQTMTEPRTKAAEISKSASDSISLVRHQSSHYYPDMFIYGVAASVRIPPPSCGEVFDTLSLCIRRTQGTSVLAPRGISM